MQRKQMLVSVELMAQLFKLQRAPVTTCVGIPMDARIVDALFRPEEEWVVLIWESASFDVIEPGANLPFMIAQYGMVQS